MSVIAARKDLTGPRGVDKGRYFSRTFVLPEGFDLTGYAIKAQAKEDASKSSAKIIDFVVVIDVANRKFTISFDATAASITQNSGYYDIVATPPGGKADTWVYGKIDFADRPTD